jgi:hypothetical protein
MAQVAIEGSSRAWGPKNLLQIQSDGVICYMNDRHYSPKCAHGYLSKTFRSIIHTTLSLLLSDNREKLKWGICNWYSIMYR